jgi:hypothetical protein
MATMSVEETTLGHWATYRSNAQPFFSELRSHLGVGSPARDDAADAGPAASELGGGDGAGDLEEKGQGGWLDHRIYPLVPYVGSLLPRVVLVVPIGGESTLRTKARMREVGAAEEAEAPTTTLPKIPRPAAPQLAAPPSSSMSLSSRRAAVLLRATPLAKISVTRVGMDQIARM